MAFYPKRYQRHVPVLKTCLDFGVVWERTKQRWSNVVQRNKHGTDAQLQYKLANKYGTYGQLWYKWAKTVMINRYGTHKLMPYRWRNMIQRIEHDTNAQLWYKWANKYGTHEQLWYKWANMVMIDTYGTHKLMPYIWRNMVQRNKYGTNAQLRYKWLKITWYTWTYIRTNEQKKKFIGTYGTHKLMQYRWRIMGPINMYK